MLTRARILELTPQQGMMCLLDEVVGWSDVTITCRTRSHLSPDNPLRRDGGLAGICGIEYGLQAAALHGAIVGGGPQPLGYLAALRSVEILAARLDCPLFGTLEVAAQLELRDVGGLIYGFRLRSATGADLLSGRATIVLPAAVGGLA
ncbi:MAG TPA: phosphotransferase [Acetobacteraceae bacterium]|nr:phosphotransferase [Acetobacteraceae bacterium]